MKKHIITFVFVILFSTKLFSQGGGTNTVFDGSDDYLDLGNNFKFTSAFTIEMWAYAYDWTPSSNQTLISNFNAGGYRIRLRSPNYISFYIYKAGDSQRFISYSTINLSDGWHHISCTYDNSAYKLFINGAQESSGGGYTISYDSDNHTLIGAEAGTYIDPAGEYFDGYIDELRIWNRVLSETEINDWMNKPITSSSRPSYISNLQGYYKLDTSWSNDWLDDCSGDVGGANNIVATNHDATTTTSNIPIGDFPSGYTTDAEALWRANGTINSEASTGLWMSVGTTLTDANFAVFGNNNETGKSTDDLPSGVGVDERTARIWYVDKSGTVSANLTIDIGDATGYTKTAETASSYKLLYRAGTSGTFSKVADGNSVANTDQVTFNSYTLQDGYYAMGGPSGGLPVKLSSFTAFHENGAVVLQWTTESEAGGVGFIIDRRSAVIADWQQIASYITDKNLVCLNNPLGNTKYTFTDNNAEPNTAYFYRLSDVDIFGNVTELDVIEISLTGVIEISSSCLPEKTELIAAYPNPFNPQTKISYQLAQNAVVDLQVYNVLGQRVRQLLSGVNQSAGNYNIYWNGKNDAGEIMSSGTFIIVLKARDYVRSEKVLLLR